MSLLFFSSSLKNVAADSPLWISHNTKPSYKCRQLSWKHQPLMQMKTILLSTPIYHSNVDSYPDNINHQCKSSNIDLSRQNQSPCIYWKLSWQQQPLMQSLTVILTTPTPMQMLAVILTTPNPCKCWLLSWEHKPLMQICPHRNIIGSYLQLQ